MLELNRRDGGDRRFILVTNNENKICEQVNFPRLKRVMTGYSTRTGDRVAGLGGNLRYLKTTFVPKHVDYGLTDEDRLEFTRRANLLLALKEHTFTPVTTTDHYEIVASPTAITGIYFRENKVELAKLLAELDRSRGARSVTVYIFSWAKGAYKTGFEDYPAFRFEDIPEPILEVYKSIGY